MAKIDKKSNLAQYVNLKEVANGSHSTVYIAEDSVSGRNVVIKKLGKDHFPMHRVENEVRALVELSKIQGVVNFYGAFETAKSFWLVFDRLHGVDLFAFLEERDYQPLDEDQVWTIFSQLLKIFNEIHNRGIAHKDIKLENIMVDRQSLNITVIDFGLCELFKARKTSPNAEWLSEDYSGSLEYIAPEKKVCQRQPYSPKKADVWSLGITLYTLLFGEFPLQFTDMCSLVDAQKQRDGIKFEFSDGRQPVSSNVIDIICKMLELNPADRPNLQQLMNHPWVVERREEEQRAL
ncbi:serine/threonine kinase [Planoprotostelium fungivorum]|uniref:non-specific serine/threonine protein kinase n=1 Tax=Planoprotostelium fungivorum TaxID=1890364 RepID=A0A2P6MXU1_9EUKA|nr:serine/threonine kinase [Planoprotostelium fungivorum]